MSLVPGLRWQLLWPHRMVWRRRRIKGSRDFSVHRPQHHPVLLSTQFIPALRPEELAEEQLESVKLLLRGGYIRQSSSGFYSYLPLGLRMVQKIESIIDGEMEMIGASRLELPSLLTSALWHKSGRYKTMGSELYKLKDRTGSEFILAPTYEEEITKLVGKEVHSWRSLPVKIYQTSKKFRDEPRPRNGLLRTREFLMKDLYTFDADVQSAQQSYKQVQSAYDAIMTKLFGERRKGWRIAEADTGAMGGSQSHEYQVQDDAGEDNLVTCDRCSYTANEELAASIAGPNESIPMESDDVDVVLFGSDDIASHSCTLSAVVVAKGRHVNEAKVTSHLSEDSRSRLQNHTAWDWEDRPEGPMVRFDKLQILLDSECRTVEADEISSAILQAIDTLAMPAQGGIKSSHSSSSAPILQDYFQDDMSIHTKLADLRKVEAGEVCSSCRTGILQKSKSIEVGHTFLLGTRYSKSLGYDFAQKDGSKEPFQMGCYGIGITRILGVLAQVASRKMQELQRSNCSSPRSGFAWNRNVAPFKALILPLQWDDNKQQATRTISEALQHTNHLQSGRLQSKDIAIDDRNISFGQKLSQADLVGYPLMFLLGKHFDKTGEVEVRHRTEDSIETSMVPLSDFQ